MSRLSSRIDRETRRLVEEILEEAGATRVEFDSHGRHPRVRFINREDKPCTYFLSGTPSDHRARRNLEAGVRRLARGARDCSRKA